ncbi:homing endonuclease [Bacillus phage Staley]|uniref:Homing endonuclease n=1 Tax=Bacillus phage Staley TaxID=1406792 RepID=U5PXM5_9CAUD|nr:homing endonuclease [Bacillus phage Staley]AGY48760.1 homing endonuclease [Bacillus phage Staley]
MKKIFLRGEIGKGMFALVDDEDFDSLSKYKWYLNEGYARGHVDGKTIYMHQFLKKAQEGMIVDHEDGNRLNNQKYNLRECNRHKNSMNQKTQQRTKTSRFKGVSKRGSKFRAYIKFQQKQIHLGLHITEEDAARAYDKKAVELFGEYASLNFK